MIPFRNSIPVAMMNQITDWHTHRMEAPALKAVINLPMDWLPQPQLFCPEPGKLYSAGIHPLYDGDWELAMKGVEQMAGRSQLFAIGECGLDKRCRATLPKQCDFFMRQMALANRFHLPLIVHCVGCWDVLLRLNRQYPPDTQRIVHGFRGKPELAKQLLSAGFYLSFGPKFNAESLSLCPPERRLMETDDTNFSIEMVAKRQNDLLTGTYSMEND